MYPQLEKQKKKVNQKMKKIKQFLGSEETAPNEDREDRAQEDTVEEPIRCFRRRRHRGIVPRATQETGLQIMIPWATETGLQIVTPWATSVVMLERTRRNTVPGAVGSRSVQR